VIAWLREMFSREQSLSARGERAAAAFLRRKGYRIRAHNLRIGKDEADIVAIAPDGRTLVIAEVKSRSIDDILPEEQVGLAKQHRLNRLAAKVQQQARFRDFAVRFDVIAVIWPDGASEPTIRHHEGAFLSKL
jgi:putative endonuclease